MLYIAQLSFHERGEEEGQGNFSCVVDADGVDAAADRVADVIERVAETTEVFDGLSEVYLDEVIQIHRVPEGGFLAHWQWAPDGKEETISTVIPGVDEKDCEAFTPGPEEGDEEGEDEGVSVTPFIVFD